jgi:opacity protein-like surface antigen
MKMKMGIVRIVMAILLLSCMSVAAQNLELYGGYNYLAQNSSAGDFTSLNGWATGAEVGFAKLKHFSLAARFTGGYANQAISSMSQNLHQYTYLAGPRLSQRRSRVRVFEHAMFGAAQLKGRIGEQSDSASSFAFALGAGADIRLNKHFMFRPAQFDYVLTRFTSSTQNNLRYSSGVVYHF